LIQSLNQGYTIVLF